MGRIAKKLENQPNTRPTGKMQVQFAICDRAGKYHQYRGLLDSGSTGNLINKKLVEDLNLPTTKKSLNWKMQGGGFKLIL